MSTRRLGMRRFKQCAQLSRVRNARISAQRLYRNEHKLFHNFYIICYINNGHYKVHSIQSYCKLLFHILTVFIMVMNMNTHDISSRQDRSILAVYLILPSLASHVSRVCTHYGAARTGNI